MAKLTLHVDEELITAAKQEAASRKTSVSKLVSDFFRALAVMPIEGKDRPLPPLTAGLMGCLEGVDDDDLGAYVDHLEEKHS